jgi:hypothetical protein
MNRKMPERLKNYLKCAAIGAPPFSGGELDRSRQRTGFCAKRHGRANFMRMRKGKKEESVSAALSPTRSLRDTV